MFVDCHNFAGSFGSDLEGKWFVALHCKTILYCVNVQGNVNSWVRVTHKINEQWSLTNNKDSTVVYYSSKLWYYGTLILLWEKILFYTKHYDTLIYNGKTMVLYGKLWNFDLQKKTMVLYQKLWNFDFLSKKQSQFLNNYD